MPFPNMKRKYLEKNVVVSAKTMVLHRQKLPKNSRIVIPKKIILTCHKEFMQEVLESNKTKAIKAFHGKLQIVDGTKNQVGVIGHFGFGAPATASTLERLIAMGVEEVIVIGAVGGLTKDMKIGDIVVCEKALRDEGTSYHYLKPSKYSYPSKQLTDKIKAAFSEMGKEYKTTVNWTTDAIYRETVAEVKRYQKEGVSTVDMELSALFAVAQYRKINIASACTVSDSLAGDVWKPKFHSVQKNLKTIYQAALMALLDNNPAWFGCS